MPMMVIKKAYVCTFIMKVNVCPPYSNKRLDTKDYFKDLMLFSSARTKTIGDRI